jgi:hypothetical protein
MYAGRLCAAWRWPTTLRKRQRQLLKVKRQNSILASRVLPCRRRHCKIGPTFPAMTQSDPNSGLHSLHRTALSASGHPRAIAWAARPLPVVPTDCTRCSRLGDRRSSRSRSAGDCKWGQPLDTTFPGHALFSLDCGDSACRKIPVPLGRLLRHACRRA